jgi:hypothetical protein
VAVGLRRSFEQQNDSAKILMPLLLLFCHHFWEAWGK